MQGLKIQAKAWCQGILLFVLLAVVYIGALSQDTSLGRTYLRVTVNGEEAGCVAAGTQAELMFQQEFKELAGKNDGRLCYQYEVACGQENEWFQKLISAEELAGRFRDMIVRQMEPYEEKSYTVAIEGYRANLRDTGEALSFFARVKEPFDEKGQFEAELIPARGHIKGMLSVRLTDVKDMEGRIPAVGPCAGLEEWLVPGYRIGLQSLEFIEDVGLYGHIIKKEELSDLGEEVAEVTKKKETNKIYEVESGDCLSVIAVEHDTTVASIVSLNGLKDQNVTIHIGQELIIAVPEPDLRLRMVEGVVYEEDYFEKPVIIENDNWYTTKEVVHREGTMGHRERNDLVTYENGFEVSRTLLRENVMVESIPAIIERGTIKPPTYVKPISGGRFTSGFGRRWGRMHKGVDFACPVGTRVFASSAGTVVGAAYSNGYGYNVLISHPDGKMTRYAHCSKLLVSVGQHVEQGETIAKSGNTGRSTGPHVHFEIYVDGRAVNPLNYIGN